MSDEELRTGAPNASTPAGMAPPLTAEPPRRAVGSTGRQPWQGKQEPTLPTLSPMREPLAVRITDIEMSFGSMVVFMVKWTLASIPAMIILLIITLAAILVINLVVG